MGGPALCNRLAVSPDLVVEAEARATQFADPGVDVQPVVEVRGQPVADVRLEDEGFEPSYSAR